MTYSEEEGEVFLGHSVTKHKTVSDQTQDLIDEEVRSIIEQNYQRSTKILKENEQRLHVMADALIRYETIDVEQIKDIMEGREPRPPQDWSDQSRRAEIRQRRKTTAAASSHRPARAPSADPRACTDKTYDVPPPGSTLRRGRCTGARPARTAALSPTAPVRRREPSRVRRAIPLVVRFDGVMVD